MPLGTTAFLCPASSTLALAAALTEPVGAWPSARRRCIWGHTGGAARAPKPLPTHPAGLRKPAVLLTNEFHFRELLLGR